MKQLMTNKNQTQLPIQTRLATLDMGEAASHTESSSSVFSVVFSTGATVRRCDVFNDCYYDEQLVIDERAIRLDRLNSGAPVLDTHTDVSLANVIGVVVPGSIRVDSGVARASIKLDSGPENQSVIRKIKDGIIRNVSVGYVVHKFEVMQKDDDSVPLYRATDWEPYEISLVPIGADSGAGIREGPSTHPCEIVHNQQNNLNHKETNMTNTNQTEQVITPVRTEADPQEEQLEAITATLTEADDDQPQQSPAPSTVSYSMEDGIKRERARVQEIQKMVRAAKLVDASALEDKLINSGASVKQARKVVLDKLAESSTDKEIRSVRLVRDEMDSMKQVIENALLHRYDPNRFKLDSSAREFRGKTLMELGRDMLERRGFKTGGISRNDLAGAILGMQVRDAGGYMSTSDFPYILANIANKTLRDAYESTPQTFKPFCRQVTMPDFKMVTRVQLGDAPSLEKVNESGEFKRGSLSESKEQYQLATYGKVIPINRQVIINDDLGAFTRLPALFGKSAADLESDTVWSIITGNMPMGDGVDLFHAKHGNVSASGGTINIQTLGAARQSLRQQKGLNGRFINVTAKYLIVPTSLETVAQQMMASTNIVYTKSPDVNPFAGTLSIIAEPRLDAASSTAWYLAGDPGQIDTIEYAYLEGNEGVHLESRVGFDVDGVELKARLDFAAKAIDHRGLYRNSGG